MKRRKKNNDANMKNEQRESIGGLHLGITTRLKWLGTAPAPQRGTHEVNG